MRKDFQIQNECNLTLRCSHFLQDQCKKIQCVIYCHGNSGSRLDCLDLLENLLSFNITVLVFDFAGSGQSKGEWVSMGYYEKEDIKVLAKYLENAGITHIGLWGWSMELFRRSSTQAFTEISTLSLLSRRLPASEHSALN